MLFDGIRSTNGMADTGIMKRPGMKVPCGQKGFQHASPWADSRLFYKKPLWKGVRSLLSARQRKYPEHNQVAAQKPPAVRDAASYTAGSLSTIQATRQLSVAMAVELMIRVRLAIRVRADADLDAEPRQGLA